MSRTCREHGMESRPVEGPELLGAGAVQRLVAADGDFVMSVLPSGHLLAASESVRDGLGWDLDECAEHGICTAVSDEGQQAAVRHLLNQVMATGAARSTVQITGAYGRMWVDVAAKH